MPTHFFEKLEVIGAHLSEINVYAIILGLMTFLLTKYILKISVFIPGPARRPGSYFRHGGDRVVRQRTIPDQATSTERSPPISSSSLRQPH